MKKLLLTITLFLFTGTLFAQTAEEWVDAGMQKFQNGNNLGAISDFDRAIKLSPNYAWAHYNRGIVNNEIREYKEAIKDFTNAVKYDTSMTIAYHGRGFAYWGLEQPDSALTDLYHFLDSEPLNINVHESIIIILVQKKDYKKALDEANRFLKLHDEVVEVYTIRGNIKLELKDTIAAINDYERCLTLNPSDYPARLALADVLFAKGDFSAAIEHYNIYLLTEDPEVYVKRAKAKLAMKDSLGAIEDYTNALRYVKEATIYFDRGLLNLQMGNYQEAVNDFTNCLELEFSEPDLAYFNRGIAYFNLNSIKACDDWHEAGQLGLKEAVDHLAKYCQ